MLAIESKYIILKLCIGVCSLGHLYGSTQLLCVNEIAFVHVFSFFSDYSQILPYSFNIFTDQTKTNMYYSQCDYGNSITKTGTCMLFLYLSKCVMAHTNLISLLFIAPYSSISS